MNAVRRILFPNPRRGAATAVACLLGLGALLACVQARAQAPRPFASCPDVAFQTIINGSVPGLYQVDLRTGAQTLLGTDAELNQINAIGFNQADGFIYGYGRATRQLVRIGQGGIAEFVGPTPAGLNQDSIAGDVVNGTYYLESFDTLVAIDIATNSIVSRTAIAPAPGAINDIAMNPIDGRFYSVRRDTGQIVRIDPASGALTVVAGATLPTSGRDFGALYFDNEGDLYAARNDGFIFRVRNPDGAGGRTSIETLTTTGQSASNNDGARCAQAPPPVDSVEVVKTLAAESGRVAGRAEAGERLTYSLDMLNDGEAATRGPYSFYEVLPAATALVSVSGGSIDCPIGSKGPRLCTITVAQIAQGARATVALVVEVDSPLPAQTQQILNLATDNVAVPAIAGCPTSNAPCDPAPACNAGDDPDHCVIVPTIRSADVGITKTNTPQAGPSDQPADTLAPGQATAYTVVVTNAGPDTMEGLIVDDPASSGVECPATNPVSCSSAAAPSPCPARSLTVADLRAGVVLSALPGVAPANTVTMRYECAVAP
ncbi:putative repeat protein (TIGR01451 family) [Lysobacter enzymogenes]|uniref:DUF6923 family protein n=1 Tax=Lysobacter enzymogenes TaxID=69 RepID=UPI0033916F0F